MNPTPSLIALFGALLLAALVGFAAGWLARAWEIDGL